MSDHMREEFEAWAKTKSLNIDRYKGCINYRSTQTSVFFVIWQTSWQASRQALEVELPLLRLSSAAGITGIKTKGK